MDGRCQQKKVEQVFMNRKKVYCYVHDKSILEQYYTLQNL